MRNFTMICEYMDGKVRLLNGGDRDYYIAEDGNQYLLREIGDRLLDANLIKSYQLLEFVGSPVYKVE